MKYKLPEECSGLFYAGKTVAVAKDGTVDLALAAAAELMPHGIAAHVEPVGEARSSDDVKSGDDAKPGKRLAK